MGEKKDSIFNGVLAVDKRTGEIVPLVKPKEHVRLNEPYELYHWRWVDTINNIGGFTGDDEFKNIEDSYRPKGADPTEDIGR